MVLDLEQLAFPCDNKRWGQLTINAFLVLDTKTMALVYQRKPIFLFLVIGVNTVSDLLMDCYS